MLTRADDVSDGADPLPARPEFHSPSQVHDGAGGLHLASQLDAFFNRYADPNYDVWKGGGSKTKRHEPYASIPPLAV